MNDFLRYLSSIYCNILSAKQVAVGTGSNLFCVGYKD